MGLKKPVFILMGSTAIEWLEVGLISRLGLGKASNIAVTCISTLPLTSQVMLRVVFIIKSSGKS